ncbi:putative ribonuclease H-like domain-containing protein [Tanacetum coccineum]
MWKIRIKQYFQVQDYALWEVIKNGNSFKPVARIIANADGTSTSTIPGPVTTEEKAQKKNDVKARSVLLMALPNEHLLTFNQYKDAKTLFKAIQARFGSNDATKKTQKTLLNQLAILGEIISQEDLNLKFLRSLPTEWNTHVVVWRNKPDLDIMSFDDLYNNFKIVEQEVKRTVTSSSNSSSQNMAFVSSLSSSNDVNTTNVQVSTASTPLSTASTADNSANLSDATVYAFLANQPNGSQLVHEDLEQIHEDDFEEMDLKWQLALLSMRARKYYQRTGKKITINRSDTAGYDKGPRNQESRPRNQDSSRKTVNVEDTSAKAMVAIDGAGFDWSFMADEEVPTNMALMAFSDSQAHNNKNCSNTCLKSYETLKTQYDNLRVEFNKSEFDLATYKRGLASIEEQLVFYKKNEVMFCDQIAVLKRDASFKDSEINALNMQIEKLKKEKESNQIKIDNYENASKSLDKLIGSQISDNSRISVGFTSYNAVAPPLIGLFAPLTVDLSNSGLEEFQQPEFEGYEVKVKKSVIENSSNEVKKFPDALIIEDWVSDCDVDEPDGTGQREVRPVWNNAMRLNHQNFSTSWRNFAPTAVLTKSGIVPISTARRSSSRVAAPVSADRPINTVAPKPFVNVSKPKPNVFHKSHSLSRRPFHQTTALKNKKLKEKVKTVKVNSVNTAKEKWVTSVVGEHRNNAVKSSACWVWRPKRNVVDHISKNCGSYICKQFDYVDPTGRLKCDNRNEFKNYEMNQFCGIKGIKREFSNARTAQPNRVAKRKNRTLIEAARTMLADSLLPIPFWAEAVNTACYTGPFGCLVTILNTLDHLGKFDGKANEGFLVGYSINSKAFKVFNSRTRKIEENLHVNFLKNKPNVAGNGPKWLFDIDTLTNTINYQPVSVGNRTNGNAGLETNSDAGQGRKEKVSDQEYILLPLLHTSSNVSSSSKEVDSSPKEDAGKNNGVKDLAKEGKARSHRNKFESLFGQDKDDNNTYRIFTPVNTVTPSNIDYPIDPLIPDLEDTANLQDTGIFDDVYDNRDEGTEADYNNLEIVISVEAMQEELLQFKLLNVWTLVDLPHGKKAIGTKWVFRNKKDQRGIVVRNKARIEAIRLFLAYASFMDFSVYQMDVKSAFLYGTIEEEVYVSQPLGFVDPEFPNRVYKVEKALYGLYQDTRSWSTKKSLSTEFEQLMHKRFPMNSMGELAFFLGLKVEQRKDGIFLSQDKYVYNILKNFGFSSVKTTSTPMETYKPLSKDAGGTDVDVHLYRSMIGSLMYLTSSRPDIMFAVCAYLRFQFQPKASHMHVVKRIFRYLKGQPTLGLWLISWQCKKQTIIANSTTKAEYIAASNCCGQVSVFDCKHWYALTTNLTIYASLIEQFWQTATVKSVNNGEQQLYITVDGQTIAITEASVRRHLQLADVDSISSLPNTEIFEQLTLMGYVSNDDKLTFQKGGDTPGSDEGSKKLNELTKLCTKLFDKVTSLEKDLKQTKKVYGKALTKLVKKVKSLEDKLKSTIERRKARMVISDDEEELVSEDPSKQGRMTETEYEEVDSEVQLDVLSAANILAEATRERVKTYNRRRRSTVSSRDSTAGGFFSTAEEILSTDERIAQKLNEKEMATATAKEEQERIDFEKALELQKQLDEREETNNIDWNVVAEQVQERQSGFDKGDLVTLWSLVKERFRSAEPIDDKERALWVELKRLFEPDNDDVLWMLQKYMHDPLTWRLYDTCGVHHVSSTRGHDIYMLIEKDYPLSIRVLTLMLSRKLQVEEDSEMARDLVIKILKEANKPRS